MPRQSSLKRQEKAVLAEVHARFDSGWTLDEIVAHLRAMGVKDVSRSALGRYKQHYDEVIAAVRQSREVAEVLVKEFGTDPEPKAMRANIEMMQAVISRMMRSLSTTEGVSAEEVAMLSRAMDSLGRASKSDADMIARVREAARKEMTAEVKERIKALGSASDLKELSDEELERKIAELAGA